MVVGFVIIGRNEGARLERCLVSVLTHSNRVVYADSASSDGSVALAQRLGAKTVALNDDGRLSAARGRNAGYKELVAHFPDCDAIQFLDGDCILQNGWIEKAVAFLQEHPEVAVVCGRRFEADPGASIYNARCDQEWNTPVGEATECGGDALVRRTAFDQVGGYRADQRAGEEPEMTARMRATGWKIWRIDALMTEHDAKILSLGQWWRRTQRGGFGYAQAWSVTKGLPQRLYGRQLRSALLWVVALPVAVILMVALFNEPALLLAIPLAYALQLARIAIRSGGSGKWSNAALVLLGKIPEALGAARFFLTGASRALPEYKAHG